MKALSAYRQAIQFLFHQRLGWFLWFPTLITMLVFYGGLSLTSWATKSISDTIDIWVTTIDWLPEWADVLQDILYWLLWIVMRIILYFVFAFFGGSIILLLMAPVLTWLSETVAARMEKSVPAFHLTRFIKDLLRAAGLALRNGFIQLSLSVVCIALGFIPLIGAFVPLLLFLINGYFYGYNFMDYSLERKHRSVSESSRFVWKHRFHTMGIGAPFALWMLIPFIGPMTAGYISLFSTVAATLEVERLDTKQTQQP
ncbi:MAG: EI24 domain-containing protein [Cryomorphaceae bacterium]